MTTQKQLSHLSFAAITLVFAALPALAQTGSADQTAMATTSNSVASEQVAALRKDRSSVPTTESTAAAPARTEKQSSFSATQFVKSVTEAAAVNDSTVFAFTSTEQSRNAFNETSSKAINFVPSRGPKLPWQ